jgi:sortase (surface protein transpeptidase)
MPEIVIYHSYSSSADIRPKINKTKFSVAKILSNLSKMLFAAGIVLIVVGFGPSVWYQVKSEGMEKISKFILNTATSAKKETPPKKIEKKEAYQPRFDPKLPLEPRIKIPSIRIDTVINEATPDNYEVALRKGVWRVSDFGTPDVREKPVILAAHRFGYLAWSIPYRLRNSFYSLPKLKVGATVEIVWSQRKYIYEVYAQGKGEEITDYSADLILYTCESLSSPVRIFEYARLLEI